MNTETINYKLALRLKNCGFDWEIRECYVDLRPFEKSMDESNIAEYLNSQNHNKMQHRISAPNIHVASKWLREVHGIHIMVIPTVTSDWTFKTINVISERDNDIINGLKSVSDLPPYKEVNGYDYSTYEEALVAGIDEAITLVEKEIKNEYNKSN